MKLHTLISQSENVNNVINQTKSVRLKNDFAFLLHKRLLLDFWEMTVES